MASSKLSTYAWIMAGVACLTLTISNGMTISGLSVYDESLQQQFGWERGAIKFRDLITFGVSALLAPFVGSLIDRIGVRICMFCGWLLLAVGYWLYGTVDSLMQVYLIHALFGLVLTLCGLNPALILVSRWFHRRRGTAIGLVLVGTSLGGILLPQYGTYMTEQFNWQFSFKVAALFPLTMAVITALWVRNQPDKSSDQDQAESPTDDDATANDPLSEGMEYRDALKTVRFWALATIAMCTFYSVLGAQAHIFLYMRDLGFASQEATNAISLLFFCALIGKFLIGYAADYLNPLRLFFLNLLTMAIGSACLASMQASVITLAILIFGLGWGGVYSMVQLSVVNSFGLKAAGKILGTITVMDALGGGLGIWLSGVFYDWTGNYQLSFAIFFGLILIAPVCLTQLRPKKNRMVEPAVT